MNKWRCTREGEPGHGWEAVHSRGAGRWPSPPAWHRWAARSPGNRGTCSSILFLSHTNPLPQTSHRSLRSDGHRERGAWWIFTSAKSVQDVSVWMALKDILVVQGEGNSPMEMQSSTCWYSYGWALGAVVFFSCNAKERFTSSWKPSDCKWPLRSGQDSLRVAKMTALSTVLQPGGYITGKSIVFKNWPLTAETGVFNYFCNRPCFQNTTATNWFFSRSIGWVPQFFSAGFYAVHLNEFLGEK